jgi:hypothetical protein
VRMLYHLWQGNSIEAERHKRELDMLRIESSARQAFENTHLVWQVTAHAAMEDLTRLKRTTEEIAAVAGEYPGWRPVLVYARAEYQRIRGDAQNAIAELVMALRDLQAGDHQLWANLAGAHVRALDDAGRGADAVRWGEQYVAEAAAAELGFCTHYILLPLCVAQAKLLHPQAVANTEHIIAQLRESGATGLIIGLAYEARARVALAMSDQAAYDEYSALCNEVFAQAGNPALSARYQRLKRDAQRRQLVTVPPPMDATRRAVVSNTVLKARLQSCDSAEARAQAALTLLAEHSGASEGFLYLVRDDLPHWAASLGSRVAPSEALHAMVREYVAAETQGRDVTTGAATEVDVRTDWTALGEALYRPVLLSHYTGDDYAITGIAVFAISPGQSFVYPSDVAASLSRMAAEAGDAMPIVVHEE